MNPQEIAPGIWWLTVRLGPVPYVNAYLLAEDEPALVDAGLPERLPVLEALTRAAGLRPSDLRHVLVTHHHLDHTGSLAALLREASSARVSVHPADAAVVRGDRPPPGPSSHGVLAHLAQWYTHRRGWERAVPARIDHALADGEELGAGGGVRVLHTPGHTAGHCSFLLPSRRHLVAGDAAGSLLGRAGRPLRLFTEDTAEADRSIRRLAELEFDATVFGHGPPIRSGAADALRRLAARTLR